MVSADVGEEANYLSYLLRLWRVHSEGEMVWRASLEGAVSGEIVSFASLDLLWGFLAAQMGTSQTTDEQFTDARDAPR